MDHDILFVGGGPAGYEGAISAAKKGLKAAVVEMDRLGGTCLQRGCIPTKAILHSVKAIKQVNDFARIGVHVEKFHFSLEEIARRKERVVAKLTRGIELLFKQRGIRLIQGRAQVTGAHTVAIDGQGEATARHIVVASGSLPAELPFLRRNGQTVVGSDELLNLDAVPAAMLVVGAGAVGLEWALIYNYLGCKVTVVEIMETVVPGSDREIAAILKNELIKQGITIHTATFISDPCPKENGVSVNFKKGEKEWRQDFDKVLLAVGRLPNTAGLFAPGLPVTFDPKGFISVTSDLETSVSGIFACGDVIGSPLLAHKASHQAMAIAEHVATGAPIVQHPQPTAIFTFPEMATVGLSEEQALKENRPLRIGRFPYAAGSRSNAIEEKAGLVKVIASEDHAILGAHIIGAEAGELLPLLAYAVSRGMKAGEFKDLVCIHPTLSENVWEALGEIGGFSIHI